MKREICLCVYYFRFFSLVVTCVSLLRLCALPISRLLSRPRAARVHLCRLSLNIDMKIKRSLARRFNDAFQRFSAAPAESQRINANLNNNYYQLDLIRMNIVFFLLLRVSLKQRLCTAANLPSFAPLVLLHFSLAICGRSSLRTHTFCACCLMRAQAPHCTRAH